MVETNTIIKESVKYTGLGDLKEFYKYAYSWLIEDGFNMIEEKYTEKVSGNSKDIEIVWKGTKKVSDYFKSIIEIKWTIFGMTDVEVEIDGKKKKMNQFVELKIDVKGILEKDYDSKWEKARFYKFWKDVYHKYVIPGTTYEREIEIKEVCQSFKEEMKAYLDLTAKR